MKFPVISGSEPRPGALGFKEYADWVGQVLAQANARNILAQKTREERIEHRFCLAPRTRPAQPQNPQGAAY